MTTIDIKLFTMANTLLLLSGDVELNPGPPGRREPKPDPKKIMEEKVNNHDEKLKMLEELVMEQKKMLEEMGGKQVELEGQISDNKVELERAAEENKVLEERVGQLQVKSVESGEQQVDLEAKVQANQVSLYVLYTFSYLFCLSKRWKEQINIKFLKNNLNFFKVKT